LFPEGFPCFLLIYNVLNVIQKGCYNHGNARRNYARGIAVPGGQVAFDLKFGVIADYVFSAMPVDL
jgi:hypothetical protein